MIWFCEKIQAEDDELMKQPPILWSAKSRKFQSEWYQAQFWLLNITSSSWFVQSTASANAELKYIIAGLLPCWIELLEPVKETLINIWYYLKIWFKVAVLVRPGVRGDHSFDTYLTYVVRFVCPFRITLDTFQVDIFPPVFFQHGPKFGVWDA